MLTNIFTEYSIPRENQKPNLDLWEKPPHTDEEKVRFIISSFLYSRGNIPRHAWWYLWQTEHWKHHGHLVDNQPVISLEEFCRLEEKYQEIFHLAYKKTSKHTKTVKQLSPDAFLEQWKHLLDTASQDSQAFPQEVASLIRVKNREELERYIKY